MICRHVTERVTLIGTRRRQAKRKVRVKQALVLMAVGRLEQECQARRLSSVIGGWLRDVLPARAYTCATRRHTAGERQMK